MTTKTIILIVAGSIVGAIVLGLLIWLMTWTILRFVYKRTMTRHLEQVKIQLAQRYRKSDIVLNTQANCFGVQSAGLFQVRGNGIIVLTKDELYFNGISGLELIIPRRDILAVSRANSHLTRTVFRPLLHVRYRTPFGEDAVAWIVPDSAQWMSALRQSTEISTPTHE
ncbi:MAG: hypothetical protein AAF639_41900 [Chloroflexota bacterium]